MQLRIQGGPGAPLAPKIFFSSCNFQTILREKPLFWANFGLRGPPPWGQNSTGPPPPKSWIRACDGIAFWCASTLYLWLQSCTKQPHWRKDTDLLLQHQFYSKKGGPLVTGCKEHSTKFWKCFPYLEVETKTLKHFIHSSKYAVFLLDKPKLTQNTFSCHCTAILIFLVWNFGMVPIFSSSGFSWNSAAGPNPNPTDPRLNSHRTELSVI